jgi:hypothetical protein
MLGDMMKKTLHPLAGLQMIQVQMPAILLDQIGETLYPIGESDPLGHP